MYLCDDRNASDLNDYNVACRDEFLDFFVTLARLLVFVAYVKYNHQILRAQLIVVAVDLVIINNALSLIVLK